jgi:hypothetical protein
LIAIISDAISLEKRQDLLSDGWLLVERPVIFKPNGNMGSWEATFTKLHVFNLTQVKRVLYIDGDILPLRNPMPLFGLPSFAASFDTMSWFNSGFMIFKPSGWLFDYMMEMTPYLESFDGGDQGFLNRFFGFRILLQPGIISFRLNEQMRHEAQKLTSKTYGIHYVGNDAKLPWFSDRPENKNSADMFSNPRLDNIWFAIHDITESKCAKSQ